MSHTHKWYLFYKTISGEVVALCEDPECPAFLSEKDVINRINAVEHTLAPDVAGVCRKVNHFYVEGVCANCGCVQPRHAGKA